MISKENEELVGQPEVHFIMLEGAFGKHEMGIRGFLKMLFGIKKSELWPHDGRWQVCDFDHFLEGNPHDLDSRKAIFGKVERPPKNKCGKKLAE